MEPPKLPPPRCRVKQRTPETTTFLAPKPPALQEEPRATPSATTAASRVMTKAKLEAFCARSKWDSKKKEGKMPKPVKPERIQEEMDKAETHLQHALRTKSAADWAKFREQCKLVELLQQITELKKVPKLYREEMFYCDACDIDFKENKQLERHCAQHQTCCIDGCEYTALESLFPLHEEMQHKPGFAPKIWQITSDEDIMKWREQRKRNFPPIVNASRKQAIQVARIVPRIIGSHQGSDGKTSKQETADNRCQDLAKGGGKSTEEENDCRTELIKTRRDNDKRRHESPTQEVGKKRRKEGTSYGERCSPTRFHRHSRSPPRRKRSPSARNIVSETSSSVMKSEAHGKDSTKKDRTSRRDDARTTARDMSTKRDRSGRRGSPTRDSPRNRGKEKNTRDIHDDSTSCHNRPLRSKNSPLRNLQSNYPARRSKSRSPRSDRAEHRALSPNVTDRNYSLSSYIASKGNADPPETERTILREKGRYSSHQSQELNVSSDFGASDRGVGYVDQTVQDSRTKPDVMTRLVSLQILKHSVTNDNSCLQALKQQVFTELIQEEFGDSFAEQIKRALQSSSPTSDCGMEPPSGENSGELQHRKKATVDSRPQFSVTQQNNANCVLPQDSKEMCTLDRTTAFNSIPCMPTEVHLSKEDNCFNALDYSQKKWIAQQLASALSATGQSNVSDELLNWVVKQAISLKGNLPCSSGAKHPDIAEQDGACQEYPEQWTHHSASPKSYRYLPCSDKKSPFSLNTTRYVENAQFGNTTRYAENAQFGNTTGYAENAQFGNTTGYAENAQFGNTTRYADNAQFGNTTRYAENSQFDNTARYIENALFGNTSRYAENAQFGNTPRYTENAQLGNTARYIENTLFGNTSRYAENAQFGTTSRYAENAQFGNTSRYAENAQFGNTSRYAENAQFGNTARYAENAQFGNTTRYAENAQFSQEQRYETYPKPMGSLFQMPVKQLRQDLNDFEDWRNDQLQGFN